MTQSEIDDLVDRLYLELVKILPNKNSMADALAVLGSMSAGLFDHIRRQNGIDEVKPHFEGWCILLAKGSRMDLPRTQPGVKLFSCDRCGKPFQVGPGTKRRCTAKYCSNACKVAACRARHEA